MTRQQAITLIRKEELRAYREASSASLALSTCDDGRTAIADCIDAGCRWSGTCNLAIADYEDRRRS